MSEFKNSDELFDLAYSAVESLTENSNLTIGELKIVSLLIHDLMTDHINAPEDTENYICPDCEDKMMNGGEKLDD